MDCSEAAVSTIRVAAFADPNRNAIKWQWTRGPAIAAADLGDPVSDGSYNLCLYPNLPGAGALGAEVLLPPGAPWVSRGEKGYSYRDLAGTVRGLTDVRVSTGDAGRTKLKVRGRGANLPSGTLPATSYTVQLVDVLGGGCWSSSFASGDSTATAFKGRSQAP